jgi:hypothetical protein
MTEKERERIVDNLMVVALCVVVFGMIGAAILFGPAH